MKVEVLRRKKKSQKKIQILHHKKWTEAVLDSHYCSLPLSLYN